MDMGLEGKVCVVTGASRGIGLETAQRLCGEGARVLFVARDHDALEEASGGCADGEFLAIDVTADHAAEEIVATCAEQMGGIDVLVHNAGSSRSLALDELDEA